MQQLFVQESVAMLVAATRRRIKQTAWDMVRPHGVTPQQFGVLMTLHSSEDTPNGMSLKELATRLGVDNPTACRLLSKLTERKLVVSHADPADKRRFCIALTHKGRNLAKTLQKSADELSHLIEDGFTAAESAALRQLLHKVMNNLDAVRTP